MAFPFTAIVRSGPTFTKIGPLSQSIIGFGSGLGRSTATTGLALKGSETKASITPAKTAPDMLYLDTGIGSKVPLSIFAYSSRAK